MHRRGCQRGDHPQIGRRELLQVGQMTLVGAGLADLLRLESQAADPLRRSAKARSVIFIFQSGGPSQHETFDPKPNAPSEIRGEYGTTATKVPGVHFCEYLPRLAARADMFSLVRTMHHIAPRQFRNEHNSCHYLLHTGTTELPVGDTNASIAVPRPERIHWPSIGSMIAYAAPSQSGIGLPDVVEIPRLGRMNYPGREPGPLGPRYARWGVDLAVPCNAPDPGGSCPNCFSHDDPNDKRRAAGSGPDAWWDNSSCRDARFKLPEWGASGGLSVADLENRAKLLEQMERKRRMLDSDQLVQSLDASRHQAWQLILTSQAGVSNPFDLSQEPARIRDQYGREEWGQALLVARRLVEAGVRMVQVNLRGWDTHQNAFRDLKGKLLPSLDQSLSGLLDDLKQRGLLDETLIVMCGEMGRTPRVSPIAAGGKNASGEVFTPGRHHWGDVFGCFFAGGGIEPGRVVGQTDKQGGLPETDAYTPSDLAATIFHLLGIGREDEFHDGLGRPFRIYRGHPIKALFG